MWVYTRKSLANRLELSPSTGLLLDYWLFLHADQTHTFWSCRPLSLRSLALEILKSNVRHDRVLRIQLKHELSAALPVLAQIIPESLPIPKSDLEHGSVNWSPDWTRWQEQIVNLGEKEISGRIADRLVKATQEGDTRAIAFLTRRLAAEVADTMRSRRQLFIKGKYEICDSGRFASAELDMAALGSALKNVVSSELLRFFVFFSISPVSTNTKLRGFRCEGVELLISDGGEIGRVLEGVRIEVHARDAAEASLEALKRIQGLLDSLRLHYYVRSNIYGAARVVLADSEDGTHIALPQPFWTPKAFRRSVPVLPLVFDKAIERFKHQDQDSLLAAKWHLSQAFAVWSEDIHSAGTRIWQAVEVLMSRLEGNLQERLELLSKLYIREIVCDAAESLADRFQDQSLQLKRLYADQGVRPDWHFRNRDRVTALKWLGRILDSRSSNYYEGWTRPAPPEMLFDPAVGLLQILNRKLRIYGAENWMELRTLSDLNLLYALRNRVVHRGERAFSFRLAEHLARVGAELILTVIGCFVEVAKTDDRNNGSPLDLRSVVETRSARGLPTVSSERYSLEGIPA